MRDIDEQISSGQLSRAKLKQRLAGGAVLLIVLAIFLPFIFNHSHQSVNSTTPTDIAPPPVANQAPPVANNANDVAGAEQAAAPQAQAETAVQSTAVTENIPAPAASVTPTAPLNVAPPASSSSAPSPAEQTPGATDQPGLTQPQSETAIPETSLPVTPQQTQPALPAQTETPAPVVVSPPTPVKPHATAARVLPPPAKTMAKVAPNGHWAVQVGSFAQAEYAQQLAGKLRASGFPVFTQRGANQLTRVYIGPLASQQQAQKIQQRVQNKFQLSGLVRETNH